MGMKNVISKRRPRQNIIFMILKNAKSKGSGGSKGSKSFTTASTVTSNRSASGGAHGDGKNSSTSKSRGHRGSGAGGATGSSYGYHGSKKGILQSAAELTRRSKRASSRSKRHGKSKGRSSRSIPFVKGQKAFYRSAKGISKVTVVGVHHDAKLEPYYTIKLKDGKEKQTDGKHLSPVQVAVKKSSSSSSNNKGGEGNSYGKQQQHQSVAAVVPEVVTDHMTESSSEAEEIIIEEVDGKGENEEPRTARGGVSVHRNPGGDAHVVEDEHNEAFSSTDNEEEEDDCVQRFSVHQDAYYRPPAGSVTKVRILSYGEDSKYPTRYAVSSPDGSRTDKVRASHLATLMDLTSKELSMLMKERNKRHDIPGKSSGIDSNLRRHQLSKSTGYDDVDDDDARGRHHQLSESTSHDDDDSGGQHHQLRKSTGHDEEGDAAVDNAVIDEGYMAEKEGGPASNASEQSLSHHHHRVDTGAVEMALEDTTSKEKEILALPPPKTVIKMVEAKTEEGGTKMVPMYEAGMHVRYKNAAGIQPAEILGAHLDDLMEPYYSIRLEDGREKQTDNAHILMEAGNDDEDEKQEEFGEEAREEVVSQAEEVKVKEEPPKEEEGVVYNEQNEKKPHSNSFSSNQQQRKSLAEQMQNVQHLPDPALERTSVSPKKRRDDYSQDPLASSTNKRNPTTLAVTSLTPTLDRTSTATKFDTGDKVIYSTSEGEQLRAVIVSSHSDKKNRPYYVVRLKKGRKKQVYGHRLQPYVMSDQDGLRKTRSRSREVSRDQTKTRGRSSSKVSKSSRGHSKNPHGRRPSESVDSHKSSESTSSNLWRRSRSPHEKIYRREESSNRGRRRRDESLSSSVRERYATEPAPQQRARRSSRQGGSRGRSQSTTRRSKSFISVSSENYHHGESSRGEGRQSRYGRERSRSRALSSEESTSQRSHSHNHQFSSAHHHHVITSSGRSSSRSSGRSSHPAIGVSMASRASSGEVAGGSVDGGGDGEENLHQPKGRSISRLRSFRKSFANRMNKN